jgi:hypothetical protein
MGVNVRGKVKVRVKGTEGMREWGRLGRRAEDWENWGDV